MLLIAQRADTFGSMLRLLAVPAILALAAPVAAGADRAPTQAVAGAAPCASVCSYKFRVGDKRVERKTPSLPDDAVVRVRVWIDGGKEIVPAVADGYNSAFVRRGVLVETQSRRGRAPMTIRAANARSKRVPVKVTIRVLEAGPTSGTT